MIQKRLQSECATAIPRPLALSSPSVHASKHAFLSARKLRFAAAFPYRGMDGTSMPLLEQGAIHSKA